MSSSSVVPEVPPLPGLTDQVERLITLGLLDRTGPEVDLVRSAGAGDGLLVLEPSEVPPSRLAPLLRHAGRAGFVVADMTDVDEFAPIEGLEQPVGPYVVRGLDRGDSMANRTPDEALPEIVGAGRTPLTLVEGLHWLLQQPEVLVRNHCFMTIGSRLRRPTGRLDARTPALWISNGTGRDGVAAKGAPKLGWCWAGNRHTWLGIASAGSRHPLS